MSVVIETDAREQEFAFALQLPDFDMVVGYDELQEGSDREAFPSESVRRIASEITKSFEGYGYLGWVYCSESDERAATDAAEVETWESWLKAESDEMQTHEWVVIHTESGRDLCDVAYRVPGLDLVIGYSLSYGEITRLRHYSEDAVDKIAAQNSVVQIVSESKYMAYLREEDDEYAEEAVEHLKWEVIPMLR